MTFNNKGELTLRMAAITMAMIVVNKQYTNRNDDDDNDNDAEDDDERNYTNRSSLRGW